MVEILLATYNGGLYIEELLQSLVRQDYDQWICKINDDGSTDDTVGIIKKYIDLYPDHFCLLHMAPKHNAKDNFLGLLKKSSSDYIMFCDQDDVWLPNKVSIMLNEIKKLEIKNGKIPTLVFSDHKVVDTNLKLIANSYFKYSGFDPARIHLNQLIFENIIPGCACIFNRSLAEQANMYVNGDVIRWHDWWVALVAASTGEIHFINRSLTLYRQHRDNLVGVINDKGLKGFLKRILRLPISTYKSTNQIVIKLIDQVQELEYIKNVKETWKPLINDLMYFENKNKLQKINCLLKYKICKNKWTIWIYICA